MRAMTAHAEIVKKAAAKQVVLTARLETTSRG